MAKQEIRQPQQKRAVQKKQQITMAGYQLFSEKGYHGTNTAEIARAAHVSTGIVYSYFEDKKAILLDVVRVYLDGLSAQFTPLLAVPVHPGALPGLLSQLIDLLLASHTMAPKAHDEFLALSLLEPEVRALFDEFEETLLQQVTAQLVAGGVSAAQLAEKVAISYGFIEQVCHEQLRRPRPPKEFETVKALAVQAAVALLQATV